MAFFPLRYVLVLVVFHVPLCKEIKITLLCVFSISLLVVFTDDTFLAPYLRYFFLLSTPQTMRRGLGRDKLWTFPSSGRSTRCTNPGFGDGDQGSRPHRDTEGMVWVVRGEGGIPAGLGLGSTRLCATALEPDCAPAVRTRAGHGVWETQNAGGKHKMQMGNTKCRWEA